MRLGQARYTIFAKEVPLNVSTTVLRWKLTLAISMGVLATLLGFELSCIEIVLA